MYLETGLCFRWACGHEDLVVDMNPDDQPKYLNTW